MRCPYGNRKLEHTPSTRLLALPLQDLLVGGVTNHPHTKLRNCNSGQKIDVPWVQLGKIQASQVSGDKRGGRVTIRGSQPIKTAAAVHNIERPRC